MAGHEESGLQGCRSMLQGILRLLRNPLKLPAVDDERPWLFPLQPVSADEDEEQLGTMPGRAVGLSCRANVEALDLKLFWKGQGQLKCICLLMTKEGKYIQHVWEGGSRSAGIRYRPHHPRCSQDAGVGADEEDLSQLDTVLGDSISLDLGRLDENVFACLFSLAGTDEGLGFASDDALMQFRELTMALYSASSQEMIFRYRQGCLRKECNILTSLCLYRGPHQTWRLEPMRLHLYSMPANKVGVDPGFAAEEILGSPVVPFSLFLVQGSLSQPQKGCP